MKKYRVSILGATDGFGAWLANYALQNFSKNIELRISGRDKKKGEKLCQSLREKYNTQVQFYTDNIEAVKEGDIIIYSVPIAYTQQVIDETLPHIRPGAIVSDVTSIKGFPSRAMSQRDDVLVIPTHPMFGPYVSSIAGQVIVLTGEKKVVHSNEYSFLKNFLQEKKARVIESSPRHHDKMMSVVQGLTHMNMYVLGDTMKRLGFDIQESMNFVSPIYKLMISSAGRFLIHNPRLYADIQMYNEEVLDTHEKYLEAAKNFHHNVADKDVEKFCSDIEDSLHAVGKENCELGHLYTDKVIYMISRQIEYAKEKIGKEITLQNIFSREILRGILVSYENGNLTMKNGEVYHIDNYEVLYK